MAEYTQADVNDWFAANPNATEADVASTVNSLGGFEANPGLAGLIGTHYGTDATGVTNAYNDINTNAFNTWMGGNAGANDVQIAQQMQNLQLTPGMAASTMGWNPTETANRYAAVNPYANMANMYNAGDYSGINSLLSSTPYSGNQIANQFGLNQSQLDEIRGKGVNLGYTTPEITGAVSNILGDQKLSPWERTNKILETGQANNVDLNQLRAIYGDEAIKPYLDEYKGGITDFLNKTFADKELTALDKFGLTHGAATKYGTSIDDLVQYGGLNKAQAQYLFDNYDKGLANVVAGLNKNNVTGANRIGTELALQSKWGTTDEELAKLNKVSVDEIKSRLDPVRNFGQTVQTFLADPKNTTEDIKTAIANVRKDPVIGTLQKSYLDKLEAQTPVWQLRDAMNGVDIAQNYNAFLAAAKENPQLAKDYAPFVAQIELAQNVIGKHALNKDFGGEYPDFAMQMFVGLDRDTLSQAPKQLEFTERKTDIATGVDEYGNVYEYERELSPATVKTAGVEPIYEGYYDDAGGAPVLTGYRQQVDSEVFGENKPMYALYDTKGTLTGYEAPSARVHVSDPVYYSGKWDANGAPKPVQGVNSGGGFLKNMATDVMGFANDLGPLGQIAMMYALGGLGSLAGGALGGGIVGNAVGSGLVSGVLSDVTGGSFEKGFLGGAVGSGAGQLAGSYMPTSMTGNPMIDAYLTKALPGAAGAMARTGVMGGDMGDAGLYSLLNTGLNMGVDYGTGKLLGETGMDKLGAAQPYVTGAASNLLASLVTGQDPNLEKVLMKTLQQQAMQTGKSALKTAAKP